MGFWPGILWYAYEASGDAALETAARGYTEALDFIARQPAYDHDIGFIMFPSFGNGFRLTGDPAYKEAVLATAERLSAMFNPAVGTILSWPREVPNFGGHNTIMDNMLNLETLLWAAENGGDPAWKDPPTTWRCTTRRPAPISTAAPTRAMPTTRCGPAARPGASTDTRWCTASPGNPASWSSREDCRRLSGSIAGRQGALLGFLRPGDSERLQRRFRRGRCGIGFVGTFHVYRR